MILRLQARGHADQRLLPAEILGYGLWNAGTWK